MMWLGLRTRVGTRRQRRAAFLEILSPRQALVGVDRDRLAISLAPLFGHDLADHSPAEMAQLGALRRYDATPELGRLGAIPTLVVSAEHDLIAPPSVGRTLAQAIPGSRYVEIAGAAHGAPIMAAERINASIAEHLAHAS